MLSSPPGTNLHADKPWAKAARKHFPQKVSSALPRPVKTFFLCERYKLLYAPIAKCGCSSLKHLMVELSELPGSKIIFKHGIHRVTDTFSTGAQLMDHDLKTVRKVLTSDEYYKFAVVREPVSRAISAYTEKFFVNRFSEANLIHTLGVIQTVRDESEPNLKSGISFRQFAEYLLASDPEDLDPHWAPQSTFLPGVDKYNDVFTMEQLGDLAARLSELTGKEIELGKLNTSLQNKTADLSTNAGRYVDMLPVELDDISGITANDFKAPDLVEKLEQYYKEDLKIYRSSLGGTRTYYPPSVSLDRVREVLTTDQEIARHVQLYSKGFFTLDSEGFGQLGVIVTNSSEYTLDFNSLPPCALVYTIRSNTGSLIEAPESQAIKIGALKPGGSKQVALLLNIPAEHREGLNNLTISLRIGDSFFVADVAPPHSTSTQFSGFIGG